MTSRVNEPDVLRENQDIFVRDGSIKFVTCEGAQVIMTSSTENFQIVGAVQFSGQAVSEHNQI